MLRSISVRSIPGGSVVGPSYASVTLGVQRVTLALLTDGSRLASSPNGSGGFQQAEEIVRLVVDELNTFAEAGPSGADDALVPASAAAAAAVRGSAAVAVEVQDFSNFLRLPLVSHALVTWNVATSDGSGCGSSGKGGSGGDGDGGGRVEAMLLSPFRPVASAAVEVQDAVISVSATAMQCLDRCLGELSLKPSVNDEALSSSADASASRDSKHNVPLTSPVSTPHPLSPLPPPPLPQQRKGYVVTNCTDRSLWFGQVSTTETVVLNPGVSTAYRWRTIPTPAATAAGRKGEPLSGLELMLRLALHRDNGSSGGNGGNGGSFGAWTEPFLADHAGTYMVSSAMPPTCRLRVIGVVSDFRRFRSVSAHMLFIVTAMTELPAQKASPFAPGSRL